MNALANTNTQKIIKSSSPNLCREFGFLDGMTEKRLIIDTI